MSKDMSGAIIARLPGRGRLKSRVQKYLYDHASPATLIALKHLLRGPRKLSFPLYKNPVVRSDAPSARVVVLAPHIDDEGIGAGGAILRHLERGNTVLVVYMSDDQNGAGVRCSEAKNVAAHFGFQTIFLGKGREEVSTTAETSSELAGVLSNFRPTEIYIPSLLDAHADHFAICSALRGALHSDKVCPATIFMFEVWTALPFPNFILDVSSCFTKKLEMLRHYASQLAHVDYLHLCTARAALHYSLYVDSRSHGHAEAFSCCDMATFRRLYDEFAQFHSGFPASTPAP